MPDVNAIDWLPIDLLQKQADFDFAMEDVNRLLKLHSEATQRSRGQPSRDLEVFKRAALILGITAWESFVEDTIRIGATYALEAAESPADVRTWFNSVADYWLGECPKPPMLREWTGDGWKTLLKERMELDLRLLNTPNSEKVSNLSRRYLGIDLSKSWFWARTTSEVASKRLDDLIRLRGELVHNSPKRFTGGERPKQRPVVLKQVVDGVTLLKKLATCTRRAIGRRGIA